MGKTRWCHQWPWPFCDQTGLAWRALTWCPCTVPQGSGRGAVCAAAAAAYMWAYDGACTLTPRAGARENLRPYIAGLVERDDGGGDLATGHAWSNTHLARQVEPASGPHTVLRPRTMSRIGSGSGTDMLVRGGGLDAVRCVLPGCGACALCVLSNSAYYTTTQVT